MNSNVNNPTATTVTSAPNGSNVDNQAVGEEVELIATDEQHFSDDRRGQPQLVQDQQQEQSMLNDRIPKEITLVVSPEESMKRNCHYDHTRYQQSSSSTSISSLNRNVKYHRTNIAWESWLTKCIRVYYNTGTIRIPEYSHGCDVLLALEYFAIVTCTSDAFIFDTIETYSQVKYWSTYFTFRPTLLEWIIQDYFKRMVIMMHEKNKKKQRQQTQHFSRRKDPQEKNTNSFVHVWITSPIDEEESVNGIVDLIEVDGEPATIFYGGAASNEHLSCHTVHELFGGPAGETNYRSSGSVMRHDQPDDANSPSIEQRFRFDFCHTILNGIIKATATNSKVMNYNVLDDFIFDISFDISHVSSTSTRNGRTTYSNRPVLRIETKPKQSATRQPTTKRTQPVGMATTESTTVGQRTTRITATGPPPTSSSSNRKASVSTSGAGGRVEVSKATARNRMTSSQNVDSGDDIVVLADQTKRQYDPYSNNGALPSSNIVASTGFGSVNGGNRIGVGGRQHRDHRLGKESTVTSTGYNDGDEHYGSMLPTANGPRNSKNRGGGGGGKGRGRAYKDAAEHYPPPSEMFPDDELNQDDIVADPMPPPRPRFVLPMRFICTDLGDTQDTCSVLTGPTVEDPTVDTMSEIGRMMKEDAILQSQIQQMTHQQDTPTRREGVEHENEDRQVKTLYSSFVTEAEELRHDCIRSSNVPCFTTTDEDDGNPKSTGIKNDANKAYAKLDRIVKGMCEPLMPGSCSATASLTAASTYNSQPRPTNSDKSFLPTCEVLVPTQALLAEHGKWEDSMAPNGTFNCSVPAENMTSSWLRWALYGKNDHQIPLNKETPEGDTDSVSIDSIKKGPSQKYRTKFYNDRQLDETSTRPSATPNNATRSARRNKTSLFEDSDMSTSRLGEF